MIGYVIGMSFQVCFSYLARIRVGIDSSYWTVSSRSQSSLALDFAIVPLTKVSNECDLTWEAINCWDVALWKRECQTRVGRFVCNLAVRLLTENAACLYASYMFPLRVVISRTFPYHSSFSIYKDIFFLCLLPSEERNFPSWYNLCSKVMQLFF